MNTQAPVKNIDLEKFLVRANAIIKRVGYVSNADAKSSDKRSTGSLALEWADDMKPREIRELTFDGTDKALAKEVAEWMAQIDTSTLTSKDYLWNLRLIGEIKTVNEKSAGYAASAIAAYEREKNKSADDKNSLQELHKAYGAAGAKIAPTTVIYLGKSQFNSRFGLCHKYQFSDAHGHKLVWMTSTELGDLKQGNAYTLEGTVKEYNSFKGKHECQITRAKVS